mgnify:CR=1 FL=1
MSKNKVINPIKMDESWHPRIIRGGSYAHYPVKVTKRVMGYLESHEKGFRICLKRK